MRWIFIAVVFLAGCSTQHQRVGEILPGMYRSEVTEILGEPDSIVPVNSIVDEWHYYSLSTADPALRMQCMGTAFQGAPMPPECHRSPTEYDLVVVIVLDQVVGYDMYDKSGRLIPKDGRQPSGEEREQYSRDYEAWQDRKAQEAYEAEKRQREYEERERQRKCEDALRRQRVGTASDHQVNDACVGRVGF